MVSWDQLKWLNCQFSPVKSYFSTKTFVQYGIF
jgi:hypothetical protein